MSKVLKPTYAYFESVTNAEESVFAAGTDHPALWNSQLNKIRVWNGSAYEDAPNGTDKVFIPFYSTTLTLTNMPLADTELPTTQYRIKCDLAGFTQFRVTFRVATAGATNSDLRFQYSLNDSAFTNLDGTNGPEIAIGTTGQKDTGWVSLHTAARVNDVYIRMMGKDGDGAADPVIRQVIIHFK